MIEFLIFYPQFLERFLEAGIEEIMGEGCGGNILAGLQKAFDNNQAAGPEQLMETLESGPERSYVSKLLISSPFLKQDEEDEKTEKMSGWFGTALKKRLSSSAGISGMPSRPRTMICSKNWLSEKLN